MLKAFNLFINISILLAIQFERKELTGEDAYHFLIEGTFGSPSSILTIALDITSSISYVYKDDYYKADYSFAYKSLNSSITTSNNDTGKLSSEVLTLNHYYYFHLHHLQFVYIIQYKQKPFRTVFLGLGRGNSSFINQIKEEGIIDKLLFQFNRSSISFGNLLDDQSESSLTKCKVIDEPSKFACKLQGIFFTSNDDGEMILKQNKLNLKHYQLFAHNVSLSFSTTEVWVWFPLNMLEYFIENYFKKEIDDGKCKLYDFGNKSYIICDDQIKDKLKSIVFAFDNMVIILKSEDLFLNNSTLSSSHLRFIIGFNAYVDNIIFGQYMIEKFKMAFSEEDSYVGFPHMPIIKEMRISITTEESKSIKNGIHFGIAMNLIGVFLVCFIKRYFKFVDIDY